MPHIDDSASQPISVAAQPQKHEISELATYKNQFLDASINSLRQLCINRGLMSDGHREMIVDRLLETFNSWIHDH